MSNTKKDRNTLYNTGFKTKTNRTYFFYKILFYNLSYKKDDSHFFSFYFIFLDKKTCKSVKKVNRSLKQCFEKNNTFIPQLLKKNNNNNLKQRERDEGDSIKTFKLGHCLHISV